VARARRFLLNFLLLAVTVLVFAGVLEIALRLIFARSLDFSMEMWKYAVALKRPSPNPRLSFAHVPNGSAFLMGVEVRTNSAGLRDREYSREKPPGVFRIVALGDSTTLGWGVPLEQTAAKILERELNASGRGRFEVLNAGVGNYNTVQEVEHYLTYGRAFHPDLVILEYFINDAEPVPHERNMGMLGHSYLAAFLISRYDATLRLMGRRPQWREYYSNLYRDGAPGFEAAKDALRRLDEVTRADGTGLLVAILPELHQIGHDYPFAKEHRKIEDFLALLGVPAMDLIGGLRGGLSGGPESALWVTPGDAHPNGKANALIVSQIAPWVLNRRAAQK
jgi:hypothetical protein